MSQLTDNLYTIDAIKSGIRSAIEEKGVDMTGLSFPDYPGAIASISTAFVTEPLFVSVNGTYTPSAGIDGFSQVTVDVPQSVTGFTEKELTEGVQIVNLSNNASSVCSYAFTSNSYLQTVNLPNCSRVNDLAFARCSNLTTVSLPVCEYVWSQAFMYLPKSIQVYMPECKSLGYGVFYQTPYLYSISLPKCNRIENEVFAYCYWLSDVYLPECSYIGNNAFTNCARLQSINIEGCLELGQMVFFGISSAFSLSLPLISKIGGNAIMNCSQFSQLTLCTGTYTIPSYNNAFNNTPLNQGIGSIYVDAALYDKFISSTGWSAFSSLFVSVGTSDPMLSFNDGLLYGKTNILMSGYSSYLDVTINNSSITSLSFSQCKSVGYYCFNNQKSITDVILPECTYVSGAAFSNCSSLTNVELPKCSFIGTSAFYNCNVLSIISLPECTYISNEAFYWLNQLASVYLPGSAFCSIYDSRVFSQYSLQTPLVKFYVNSALVDTYKNDSKWSWYSSRIFPIE